MIDWQKIAAYSLAGVALVCVSWLVSTGALDVPDDVAREGFVLALGVCAGWLGLRRPGDVAR